MEFLAWPKTPRLFRDIVVTEKIDGTNGCTIITEDGEVGAQSRKRLLPMGPRGMDDGSWQKQDNAGFAAWVSEHKECLVEVLGSGYHYGEWWGHGIQRGYGLQKGDRRFSLFNTERWGHFEDPEQFPNIPGLGVVPVLYRGVNDTDEIHHTLTDLMEMGSAAVPGYMNPEGVIVYHSASRQCFKVTLDGDGGKWRDVA